MSDRDEFRISGFTLLYNEDGTVRGAEPVIAHVDADRATLLRVRWALRCMERFRDELPARSGYGEGLRQAYIDCAKLLRTALDQEANE